MSASSVYGVALPAGFCGSYSGCASSDMFPYPAVSPLRLDGSNLNSCFRNTLCSAYTSYGVNRR